MSNRLDYYFDYIESYYVSFEKLYKENDKEKYFFPLGLIYANFMELWIKEAILGWDGFLDEYSIDDFKIGTHDFDKLLSSNDTVEEFAQLGISKDEIEQILIEINTIKEKVGTSTLSFAFRYPCDKKNGIYIKTINKKKKIEILELMNNSIQNAMQMFTRHIHGVVGSLAKTIKIMKAKMEKKK